MLRDDVHGERLQRGHKVARLERGIGDLHLAPNHVFKQRHHGVQEEELHDMAVEFHEPPAGPHLESGRRKQGVDLADRGPCVVGPAIRLAQRNLQRHPSPVVAGLGVGSLHNQVAHQVFPPQARGHHERRLVERVAKINTIALDLLIQNRMRPLAVLAVLVLNRGPLGLRHGAPG